MRPRLMAGLLLLSLSAVLPLSTFAQSSSSSSSSGAPVQEPPPDDRTNPHSAPAQRGLKPAEPP